jgi:hypothetical protein
MSRQALNSPPASEAHRIFATGDFDTTDHESMKTALDKINDNFVELYATRDTQPVMAVYNTDTATDDVALAAAKVTGAEDIVVLGLTGALGAGKNAQLPTVAAVVAAMGRTPAAGSSYRLRVINSSSGAFAWTVTTNTGWTLAGTMTIAQNTWREFIITFASATAATLQSVGTGTHS